MNFGGWFGGWFGPPRATGPPRAYQPLDDAIAADDLERLGELLEHGYENVALTLDELDHAFIEAATRGSVAACCTIRDKLPAYMLEFLQRDKNFFYRPSPFHAAASGGRLEHVVLLAPLFNVNQGQGTMNQTPLCCAAGAVTNSLEISRFLVERGADVNRGGNHGPLYEAVKQNNADTARYLLVEAHANPNLNLLPVPEQLGRLEHQTDPELWPSMRKRNTDMAMENGNPPMLSILLPRGAHIVLGDDHGVNGTSLNNLIRDDTKTPETKQAIVDILIGHATSDSNTASDTLQFLLTSVTCSYAIQQNHRKIAMFLAAGVNLFLPQVAMFFTIQGAQDLERCRMLMDRSQIDPFQAPTVGSLGNNGLRRISAFVAATRLGNNTAILNLFLDRWDAQFDTNGGKNARGDFPLHLICGYSGVSIQAVTMILHRHIHIKRYGDSVLKVVDSTHRLVPFMLAATCDAGVDVIYDLLRKCPDALPPPIYRKNYEAIQVENLDLGKALRAEKDASIAALRQKDASIAALQAENEQLLQRLAVFEAAPKDAASYSSVNAIESSSNILPLDRQQYHHRHDHSDPLSVGNTVESGGTEEKNVSRAKQDNAEGSAHPSKKRKTSSSH